MFKLVDTVIRLLKKTLCPIKKKKKRKTCRTKPLFCVNCVIEKFTSVRVTAIGRFGYSCFGGFNRKKKPNFVWFDSFIFFIQQHSNNNDKYGERCNFFFVFNLKTNNRKRLCTQIAFSFLF